jgi:hypothetical protein
MVSGALSTSAAAAVGQKCERVMKVPRSSIRETRGNC